MRFYSFILLLLVLSLNPLRAQIPFRLIDVKPEIDADLAMVLENRELVVADVKKLLGFESAEIVLKKWNGVFWSTYPALRSQEFQMGINNKLSIEEHEGMVYVAGSFRNANETIDGIARLNGSVWESVDGGIRGNYAIRPEISIQDLQSYMSELFVCGTFNEAGSMQASNLASWNSGTWTNYATNAGSFNSMTTLNDTLYIGGFFNEVEGISSENLIAYYKGTWNSVQPPVNEEILFLGSLQGQLIAICSSGCYLRTASEWALLAGGWKHNILDISSIVEFESQLFISGTFNDGAGLVHLIRWTGTTWESHVREEELSPRGQMVYPMAANQNTLYYCGSINWYRGIRTGSVIEFKPGSSLLEGRVYLDHNQNCVYDQSDEVIPGVILSYNNGEYFSSSDENGLYSMFIPNNSTHRLEIFQTAAYLLNCEGAVRTFSTNAVEKVQTEDFAYQIAPDINPLSAVLESSSAYTARLGYTNFYRINTEGAGLGHYPLMVELKHDAKLSQFTFSKEPLSTSDSLITWQLDFRETITFTCLPETGTFESGDSLLFELLAYSKQFSTKVFAEHRLLQALKPGQAPNNKDCNLKEIPQHEEFLEYYIRFQNLGFDTIQSIHIVDTIHFRAQLQYLKVLGSSHSTAYSVSFRVRDHAIIWSFSELNLPPQFLAGDKASSGYVNFRIRLVDDLSVGDSVLNRAVIYFEQEALSTNEVISVVVESTLPIIPNHRGVVISPNPSGGETQIAVYNLNAERFEVIRSDGKQMMSGNFMSETNAVIADLSGMGSGMYFIRIYHSSGVLVERLLIQ